MLSVFSIAFISIGLATALPTVMGSFDAAHLYPWAFTTMVSGMLLATTLAGRWADTRGPAWPMYAGFVLFVIGMLLGWLAPSVWFILVSRLVQGLGAGALNLSLSVTIAHAFPAKERPRVMALVSFCWLLPAFVGPPIAAWLTRFDWRLVFVAMLPLVAVSLALTIPAARTVQSAFVPDSEDIPSPKILPTAAITIAPSLILLAGQQFGIWSVVSAVVGVVALAWGLGRTLAPSTRGFGAGLPSVVLSRAVQAGSFFAAETILLVTLQDLRGLDPFSVGLALTVGSVGWTAGSWLQARPTTRIAREAFITLGGVLTAVGIAVLVAFAWWAQLPLLVGLAGWILAGVGMGLTMPSSAVAVMSLSTQFEQGRNQSSMQVSEAVGNSVVTAVAGGIYTALLMAQPAKLSFSAALAATLIVSLAAVLISRRIGPIPADQRVRT